MLGYIRVFILDTAKSSQRFAHQIIWNMKANMYKDESCQEEDSIKPVLDSIISNILDSLAGSDKQFYEKEFTFFQEVTGISGKLKPLVQADASKIEKKVPCFDFRKRLMRRSAKLSSLPEYICLQILNRL